MISAEYPQCVVAGNGPEISDEQRAAIEAEVERLLGPRITEFVEEQPEKSPSPPEDLEPWLPPGIPGYG
jgi:hypothetical protein